MTPEEKYTEQELEEFGQCSKNHYWTPENTLYESAGRGSNKRRRRCRACRRDRRMESAAAAARENSGDASQALRYRGGVDYLFSAERAAVDFDYALKYISTPCEGRFAEFTDYELDAIPSPAKADSLCREQNGERCILYELCRDRVRSDPISSSWGVWGGDVWVDGEIFEGGTD